MIDGIIAKEGQKLVFYSLLAFIFFVLIECAFLTFISFALMLFFIYAYRYRYIDFSSFKKEEYLSPISGTITAIDVKDFQRIVHIDVSLCDSHILRSFDEGEGKVTVNRGLNLLLGSFKSKKMNDSLVIEYKKTKMQIISSMFNRTINIDEKKPFKKGEKIGVFLDGEVIITLAENMNLEVKIGDKVQSGETLIAKITK